MRALVFLNVYLQVVMFSTSWGLSMGEVEEDSIKIKGSISEEAYSLPVSPDDVDKVLKGRCLYKKFKPAFGQDEKYIEPAILPPNQSSYKEVSVAVFSNPKPKPKKLPDEAHYWPNLDYNIPGTELKDFEICNNGKYGIPVYSDKCILIGFDELSKKNHTMWLQKVTGLDVPFQADPSKYTTIVTRTSTEPNDKKGKKGQDRAGICGPLTNSNLLIEFLAILIVKYINIFYYPHI